MVLWAYAVLPDSPRTHNQTLDPLSTEYRGTLRRISVITTRLKLVLQSCRGGRKLTRFFLLYAVHVEGGHLISGYVFSSSWSRFINAHRHA